MLFLMIHLLLFIISLLKRDTNNFFLFFLFFLCMYQVEWICKGAEDTLCQLFFSGLTVPSVSLYFLCSLDRLR